MREFFCLDCGLFYCGEQYVYDHSGKLTYNTTVWDCPNPECKSNKENGKNQLGRMSTDSTGYAYFLFENQAYIRNKGWSSSSYAPREVLTLYRKNGIRIHD